ncbi:hypothetical protein OQA88_11873 [Cercophora sp. LCS_1]
MASTQPLRNIQPSSPLYTHTPLAEPDKSIRLLHIQRDAATNAISFSLATVRCTREGRPVQDYEAISWRWDAPGTCTLTISGANLPISSNMHGILQQLILGTVKERYVWIDSICINQTSEDEQKQQIRLMTTVYSHATRVLAFPPPFETEPTHLPLAAEFLDWLSVYLLVAKVLPTVMRLPQGQQFIGMEGDLPHERDRWSAFLGLVSSCFWQRAWIIQEIVVGKAVTIRYGGKEIDFTLLGNLIKAFKPTNTPPLLNVGGWVGAERMAKFRTGIDLIVRLACFRELYAAGQMPSVPDILMECVQSNATYAVDKVNALAGIGAGMHADALNNISDKDASDDRKLFIGVTRYCLKNMTGANRYKLLAMAGLNNEGRRDGWPSWVPDLDVMPKLKPLGDAECPYTTGYSVPPRIPRERSEDTLIINGIRLTTLEYVDANNPFISLGGGHIDPAQMALFNQILTQASTETDIQNFFTRILLWLCTLHTQTLALYENIGHSSESYRLTAGQSLLEAILRTVIADHDASSPASPGTLATIGTCLLFLQITADLANLNQDENVTAWRAELHREARTLRLKNSGINLEDSTAEARQRMQTVRADINDQLRIEIQGFAEMNDTTADRVRRSTLFTRNTIARRAAGRQFALSKDGFMLLVPEGTKKGDVVVIFGGARTPYLLRPCGDSDDFCTLVGEAYLHGFGQAGKQGRRLAEMGRRQLFCIA